MRTKQLNIVSLVAVLLMALCLGGCTRHVTSKNPVLWVLTEESHSDGMNYQAQMAVEAFAESHPEVTVNLEILPLDDEPRQARMKRLRTQIMSGKGPDVYLLPTGSQVILRKGAEPLYVPIDPLFHDVTHAMELGTFFDLSALYDADTDLNTAALKPEIMEAGCRDGHRWVLPLRFDLPVIYTQPQQAQAMGIPESLFHQDFLTIVQTLCTQDSPFYLCAGLVFPQQLDYLAPLVDYSTGQVLLSQQQLGQYLRLCQQGTAVAQEDFRSRCKITDDHRFAAWWDKKKHERYRTDYERGSVEEYNYLNTTPADIGSTELRHFNLSDVFIWNNFHWLTEEIPFFVGSLSSFFDTAYVSKYTKTDFRMYPLRTPDGGVQAQVTYWGAVGSTTADPKLAYEFLRQFLTEDYQWDVVRHRIYNMGRPYWEWSYPVQKHGLVEDSWPVRTQGSVAPLWENFGYQITDFNQSTVDLVVNVKAKAAGYMTMTHQDIPALDWPIDSVCFPISLAPEEDLKYAIAQLNAPDGTPTDADIDQLTDTILRALWWHAAQA